MPALTDLEIAKLFKAAFGDGHFTADERTAARDELRTRDLTIGEAFDAMDRLADHDREAVAMLGRTPGCGPLVAINERWTDLDLDDVLDAIQNSRPRNLDDLPAWEYRKLEG